MLQGIKNKVGRRDAKFFHFNLTGARDEGIKQRGP